MNRSWKLINLSMILALIAYFMGRGIAPSLMGIEASFSIEGALATFLFLLASALSMSTRITGFELGVKTLFMGGLLTCFNILGLLDNTIVTLFSIIASLVSLWWASLAELHVNPPNTECGYGWVRSNDRYFFITNDGLDVPALGYRGRGHIPKDTYIGHIEFYGKSSPEDEHIIRSLPVANMAIHLNRDVLRNGDALPVQTGLFDSDRVVMPQVEMPVEVVQALRNRKPGQDVPESIRKFWEELPDKLEIEEFKVPITKGPLIPMSPVL